MDVTKQKILLDAFEQFPEYHFLWKFEDPTIDLELPKNVIIRPWLPQSDILAHPKIKGFFTHSGESINDTLIFIELNSYSIVLINRHAKYTGSNLERCSNTWNAICL